MHQFHQGCVQQRLLNQQRVLQLDLRWQHLAHHRCRRGPYFYKREEINACCIENAYGLSLVRTSCVQLHEHHELRSQPSLMKDD